MNRVLLVSKTKSPTREELVTSERRMGELLFAPRIDLLRWAGYVIVEGQGIKAANWVVDSLEDLNSFLDWFHNLECDEVEEEHYEIQVYANGKTPHGGQCEVRVA